MGAFFEGASFPRGSFFCFFLEGGVLVLTSRLPFPWSRECLSVCLFVLVLHFLILLRPAPFCSFPFRFVSFCWLTVSFVFGSLSASKLGMDGIVYGVGGEASRWRGDLYGRRTRACYGA